MSSLHPWCRGIQMITTTTKQVTMINISIICEKIRQISTYTTITKSVSLLSVFYLVLNLVYIIIPTIPLILLLLTVTGVCCFKLIVQRWGSKIKSNTKCKNTKDSNVMRLWWHTHTVGMNLMVTGSKRWNLFGIFSKSTQGQNYSYIPTSIWPFQSSNLNHIEVYQKHLVAV